MLCPAFSKIEDDLKMTPRAPIAGLKELENDIKKKKNYAGVSELEKGLKKNKIRSMYVPHVRVYIILYILRSMGISSQ